MTERKNIYVVIMAGGIGSRFWPESREDMPKQFLDILGVGRSLLRLTFERFTNFCPAENILVITNERYRVLVQNHIPELAPEQILGEPSRNNTAPSVCYASFRIRAMNPDACFVVAPSDQVVLNEGQFVSVLHNALSFVEKNDVLVTLGIKPTRPDTGYGYIEYEISGHSKEQTDGIHRVKKFTEKPDPTRAQRYLESGRHLWNAGIFVWSVASILNAYRIHAPMIYSTLARGIDSYNSGEEEAFIAKNYRDTPNISVDFAILEKADNIYTIPSDFGWSDLGTWASLYQQRAGQKFGNVVDGGYWHLEECEKLLVRGRKDKAYILRSLANYVIIDQDDVLLIHPMDREQELKELRQKISEDYNGRLD